MQAVQVSDIDLTDPDIFQQAVPYEHFARLRKEAPVSWSGPADTGFWNIVRYADIVEVEKNVEVFTNKTSISPLPVPRSTLASTIDHSIILSDPPRHTFLRKAIMSGFTPKAVQRLEERIRQCAAEAIDAVIEKGECDLHDVAAYTPIEVVADVLGVPAHDRQRLFDWANAMFGSSDPEVSSPAKNMMGAMQMFSYARRLAKKRRAEPGEDVFSLIALAQEEGEALSDIDLGATFIVLATAGNETTRTQFLHGVLALIEHPQAMAALREDLSLVANAVEEMLRWTTPALGFAREATRDIEIGGQLVRAGQRVMLWYCSGNRDESVFPNADTFDIRRANANRHLAFGSQGGVHRCLGAMLARAELIAMFKEVATRMPDIQLNGPVTRLRSNFTNGIKAMPVRFTPGKAKGNADHVRMYATGADSMTPVAPPPTPANVLRAAEGHAIQLIPLATATLNLGVPQVIANGPRGTRLIVEVASAEWKGERLNAKQLGAPAGDWALVSHEGTLSIDVRATLETDDGAMIYVSYQGRSDYTRAGAAPLVTAPLFETNDPRYLWLNKVQAIARGRANGMSQLVYDIYEVQ